MRHDRVRASWAAAALAGFALLAGPVHPLRGQSTGSRCRTSTAAGVFRVGHTSLVVATASDSGRLRLVAAVLVHGRERWTRQPIPDPLVARSRPDGTPPLLQGGTAGGLWVQYEARAGTLWLGDRPVVLGAANVALVEIDQAGAARVVGTARVDPRVPLTSPGCVRPRSRARTLAVERALLATVRRADAARAFLDG